MAAKPQVISSPSAFASVGVTAPILAHFLGGCDEKTIRNYAKAGLAVKLGHGRYALSESCHRVTKWLREQAAGRMGRTDEIDAVKSGAMLKDAQRHLAEVRAAKLAGELISQPDLESAWTEIANAVRQLFLSVPSRARFDIPHLTGADQQTLERLMRDMLAEVAFMDVKPRVPIEKGDESEKEEVVD